VTAGDPVPLGNPFASRRCLYYNRLPRRVQVPLLTNISTPGTDHAATAMSHFPAEQTGNPLAATPSARYEPSYAKRPMTLPTAGCSETVCPEGKHLLDLRSLSTSNLHVCRLRSLNPVHVNSSLHVHRTLVPFTGASISLRTSAMMERPQRSVFPNRLPT